MTERTINLTPKAVEAAQKQLLKRGTPDAFLRLGIRGGACSGYEYVILIADEKHSRDLTFEFDGLQVIVDPKSLVLLDKATLDYEAKLVGGGFRFDNPQAVSKCGCGASFDVGGAA